MAQRLLDMKEFDCIQLEPMKENERMYMMVRLNALRGDWSPEEFTALVNKQKQFYIDDNHQ
jgi:hypothetical protein